MYDIKLQGITKKFDAFTAVNDINFTIPKSSVTVLLGPSGCGKTTLMRMIAGLESPTEEEFSLMSTMSQMFQLEEEILEWFSNTQLFTEAQVLEKI